MNKYLTGQCSEEEIIEVNAWMKESEENARQLFRMEEIYHLGKFDRYADEQRIAHAEKLLYKKLDEAKGKQAKTTAYASLDEICCRYCRHSSYGRRSRVLVLS